MAKRKQAVSAPQKKKVSAMRKNGRIFLNMIKPVWQPKIISVFALLLLAFVVYDTVDMNSVLPVKSVQIEGEFNYLNKKELQNKALPVVEGGFFNVNLKRIRISLMDLPWVEDISVRRQWPDQILIRVIEKQPVVYWGKEGLLSARGELFVPEEKISINLPRLFGPDGQHQMMLKEFSRMQAWLLDAELHIQTLELDARRSWILQMTNGLELRLGRKQLHERLQLFVSMYDTKLQQQTQQLNHVDMRYTNGFAVAWKEA